MEWLVDLGEASEAVRLGLPLVARDDCAVAHLRNAVGRVEWAVAVDDEPAVTLQEQRRVEQARELARHRLGADVVSDMPEHFGSGKTKVAEPLWNGNSSMLADDHETCASVEIDHLDRPRVGRRQQTGEGSGRLQRSPTVAGRRRRHSARVVAKHHDQSQ